MTDWPAATIQADFDRIARAGEEQGWNHNNHYHPYLLRHLPSPCQHTLEIGCGTGAFARLLAQRADHVLALDLSPEMIRLAQERSQHMPTIEYQVGDILAYPLPDNHFAFIGSIATFHHLSLAPLLAKVKTALKPGGVLAALDLYTAQSTADYLTAAAAVPVSKILQLRKNGRLRRPLPQAQAAWAAHDQHDSYLPLAVIRQVCAELLPGAIIKRHLLWRYSLIWQKPTVPS
ncbi:MAG: class I SAM-dependent methyltransferase [Caldilineaceae bacterium]